MSPQPIRPGEGQFPDDQISIPVPPSRFQTGQTGIYRRDPSVPVTESYRQTIIRIWPLGIEERAIDLAPAPGEESQSPTELFGPEVDRVYVISGVKAFDRLTTRMEDADTLLRLRWRLDFHGWDWRPTVATSPDRAWVEGGAILLDGTPEQVLYLAQLHGQSVVLRWNEHGMAPVPVVPGVDVGDPTPVPVRLRTALTGCPLRCGADGVCKVYGGPWTSSSREAALVWQHHRAMLIDAFGCDVCQTDGGRGARGAVDLFTPSRTGGWQWGTPRQPSPSRTPEDNEQGNLGHGPETDPIKRGRPPTQRTRDSRPWFPAVTVPSWATGGRLNDDGPRACLSEAFHISASRGRPVASDSTGSSDCALADVLTGSET